MSIPPSPESSNTTLESKWRSLFTLPSSKLKSELKKLDFSQVTPNNQNILHIACIDSNKEAINLILTLDLIDSKLNINLQDSIRAWSPLYYIINSCDNGQPDLCEQLIKSNALVNIADSRGITPLHLAVYKGQDDNCEYFIKQKANINAKDKHGRVPLVYAIIEGQTNCVQALIDAGADLNAKDVNDDTLLHYAVGCKGNGLLYAGMLIEKGVDVNCKDKQGNTALMVAAKKNPKENVRLIQMLIEKGGNVDDVNNEGDCFYSLLGKEAVKNGFVSSGNNDIKDHEEMISENKGKVGVKDFVIFFIIPFMILFMSSKLIK